jgi:hypothetical protein
VALELWRFADHRAAPYINKIFGLRENELMTTQLEYLATAPGPEPLTRPKIVCLCGSTRFMEQFFEQGWQETLAGNIVLSVGVCKHAEHHGGEALGPEVCAKLDELHLRKIDLADEVKILNVGDYIGDSTRRELEQVVWDVNALLEKHLPKKEVAQ